MPSSTYHKIPRIRKPFVVIASVCTFGLVYALTNVTAQSSSSSNGQPETESVPHVVTPGKSPADPPSDAVVLFNGKNLSLWRHPNGSPAGWTLNEDHSVTIKPGTGSIISTETFADAQIHIEFKTPAEVRGSGQSRGNSGVYIHARYEVQVLDSFENETYHDGQCGAVYGQYPPLVNACRKPGEWQTYDIIFHPPIFNEQHEETFGGSLTVFQNGVLIQDHVEIKGPTTAALASDEPGVGPLLLQDHGNPVQYRNIWFRRLD